jgi:quinol monooxygenase YgiN
MIVLAVVYHVTPGKTDQVLADLAEMGALVKAHEPGCAMYQVSRSTENDDHLLLYEQYVDDAALQAHRETPHFKAIIEDKVIPALDSRVRSFYDLVIG